MTQRGSKATTFATLANLAGLVAIGLIPAAFAGSTTAENEPQMTQDGITKYVRYAHDGGASYGILDGDTIHELDGNLFESPSRTGNTTSLSDVELLAPVEPSNVIAVGLNYASHIGNRPAPEYPGLFAKFPTSIVGPGADIVIPADAENVHYEGELVIVIGKQAKNVSIEDAPGYIFGVTAGNDGVGARLAGRRPAMAACQGVGYFRPHRSGDR